MNRLLLGLLVAVCAAYVVALEVTVLHDSTRRAMAELWRSANR